MASSAAPSDGAENEPNEKEAKAAGSSNPLESFDRTASTSKDVVEKFIAEVLRPNVPSTAATAGSDQVAAQLKDIVNPPPSAKADLSTLKPDAKVALNMQLFIRQLVQDKGLKGAADLLKGMSAADRAKLNGWDIQVNGIGDSNTTFAIKKGGVDVTSVRGVDIQASDGKVGNAQWAGRAAERFEMLAGDPRFLKAALTGLTALVNKERQPGGLLADPAAFSSFINAFNARLGTGPDKMQLSATDKGLALKRVPGVTGDITSEYVRAASTVGDTSTGDASALGNYFKAGQSRVTDLAALSSQPGVNSFQLSEKFSDVLRAEFARTGADPAKLVEAINAGLPKLPDGTKYAARVDAATNRIVFEKLDPAGKPLQVLRRVGVENLGPIDAQKLSPDELAKRMAAFTAEAIGVMSPPQRELQLARANQWLKAKPDLAQKFFDSFNQELLTRPETSNLLPKLKPADATAGSGPEVFIDKTVGRDGKALTAAPAASIDILDVPLPSVSGDVPDPIKQAIQQLDAGVPNMKRFTDAITDPTKLTGFKAGDSILRIAPNGQDRISAVVSAVDASGKPTELTVQIPVPAGQAGPPQIIKVPFDQFVAQTNGLGDKSVFVGFRPKAADAPRTTNDAPATATPVDLAKIMGPEAFAKLTDPQKQNLAVLFDGNASPDAKLKAAEALWTSGMRNFKINDNNDKQRTVTLQKSGIMMHVFTTDDRGRTTIAIRGVKRGENYAQQVDKRGRPVSFIGDHFLKNGGENSVLNGKGTDAPVRPADNPVTAATTMKPNDYAAFNASMSKIFATSDPTMLNNRSVVNDFTAFLKASAASQDTPEVKTKALQEAFASAVRAEAALNPMVKPQDIAARFQAALGDQAGAFKVVSETKDGKEVTALKVLGQGTEQSLLEIPTGTLGSPAGYFADLVKGAKSPGEVARLFSNFTRIENSRNPTASAAELQKRLNDALTASGTGYTVALDKYGTPDSNLLLFRKNQAGAQELVSRIDPRHIQVPGQQENVLQLAGRLAEPLAALQGDELKAYWQQVTSTMKDLDPARRELLIKSIQAELAKRPESKHLTITPNADSLSLNSNREGKTEAVASARFDAVVTPEVINQPAVPGGAADLKKILGDAQLAGKTPEQLAALQAFFKPGAKPEEQLAAAKALVALGIKSFKVQDGDKSRTVSLQVEKAGKRSKDSYVHVYATDDKGKSRIAIRGISDDKGVIRQQGKASFYGDIWTKQIGNKSILSGATAPAGPGTPQEVPKSATPMSPLFKADQIKWDATAPVEPVNPTTLEPVIASPATVTGAPFDAVTSAKTLIDAGLNNGWFPGIVRNEKDDYDRIKGVFLNKTPDQIAQLQAEFLKQSGGIRLEAALAQRFGDSGKFLELRRLSEGDTARQARIQGDLKALESGSNVWQSEKDLRDTFGTMTKEQIAKFNEDYMKANGKSIFDAIAQAKGMTEATRQALKILTENGADGLKPEHSLQLAKIALDAKDLDMFKEVWRKASPEARTQFMAQGGESQIRSKWGPALGFGDYTQQEREALDYVKSGTLSAETEIIGNTGFFGDTEAGIEAGIDKMTDQMRTSYFAGKELAAKVAAGQPEPTDPKQKADLDYYKKTYAALKNAADNAFFRMGSISTNYRELSAYEDRIKFGKNGSFVQEVINSDGYSAKSEDQMLAAIDTMSKERWEHAKANRAAVEADLRNMLNNSLGTFGTDKAAVDRVIAAFNRKMDAGDYNAAQLVSRSLAERLDAKKGGFLGWGTDRGAMLNAIAKMDPDFIKRYKDDASFRAEADRSLNDGTLKGPEWVAARRMLDRVIAGGEPKPDILDRLVIARASGTPLNELVTELDKLMREDPQAFAKFQALSGKLGNYDLGSIRREVMNGIRDDHDGSIFWSSLDYVKYLHPMLERGKRLDNSTRMQMYMGVFGNDMEGVTKAIAAGGEDLWKEIKGNPGVMNTWNPLYNFNAEQSAYIQKLAEYQLGLPADKRGFIPTEFKIRLAILNGKAEQIKQETEAVLPQDRLSVRANYEKAFGRILTDDLIKGKTPEGQAAAIKFSGPMTVEQAADATKGLLYSNMGGRWWTSNFDATAAQAQDRVDQLLSATAQVAVTKMDLPLDQKQALVDRALQTYVNYKAAEHAVVDAGADAAFAAVGVITFIPAVAGAIETGGASLYAWGAGMAALGAVMRPGVKAILMNGEYDWRQNLLKDASIGAIEMPTYVLGPGIILRATKAFTEPALAAVKAMRLAGNPELAAQTATRVAGVIDVAPKLVTTASKDIVANAVARVTTNFEGLTADAMVTAVKETAENATRKAFTDVFGKISGQLKSAGAKPFSSESINLAAQNFSDEVLPQVLKEIGANLAGKSPTEVQALVKASIEKIVGQMADSGAFSAEAIIKALATAEIDSATQQGITQLMRQGFARSQDIPEKDILEVALKLTNNDPSRAAILAQAIRAQIPNTAEMTSKNLMDLFIKTHPNMARAFSYTAPAGLAGAASAPVRYEWDPTATFEENISRMSQQAMMGALISMAMVGAFVVPGSVIKSFKGFTGTKVAPTEVKTVLSGVNAPFLGKLEDGIAVKLEDGATVRVASAGSPQTTGFTVPAQNVSANIIYKEGKAFVQSEGDNFAQVFRNGKWEKLAPDAPLEHGQMIKFGNDGQSLVFMRATEAGAVKESAFFLPVPKLDPKVTNRVIPAVVEEAGFQPGARLRVTPGRDVATIGGIGADVRLGSTHMVEASMPVADTRSLFSRFLRRNADDVAPLATRGEVNLRNTGEGIVTVIRKDAKGNVVRTDSYPNLSSLQADARRLGNAVPSEAPKFPVGQYDEVMFGLSGKKFTAYSQNGAIRLERLADAGRNVPVVSNRVTTVLRASADDMGRVERAINAVRNQGSDIFESTRGIYNRVVDQIKSGELLDRLRNGDILGRFLRNSDFETAATFTDKKLISLGFAKIDTPSGATGTLYRNYKTGVEILRQGDNVVQVTANGRTLKINWNAAGDKVESFVMPDGTVRAVVPRGGKYNAPSLAELGPVEEGRVRLYRATYAPTDADLATRLTAKELQRWKAITAQIEEKGIDSLGRFQKRDYDILRPLVEAGNTRKFYRNLDDALAAAGKGEDGVGPTILVYDARLKAAHLADSIDLPTQMASRARQHPQSFTNTLNDGTWMINVAEASAVTHYGAQVVRDVGFRINANGFSFLSGFSDAGMLARARSIVDQAMSRVTRGIASKTGFSHLINMGERIDIGTAFGSEILSKNKYVAGRTASLLKTKDGLRLIAGEGDIVVIRNGVPVVLKNGEAVLQSGDRIIVGKAFGNGLYKGDEFVVALDSTKSVLKHTRSANNLGYLYSGPSGRVPVGLMAKVAQRNLSNLANASYQLAKRAVVSTWNARSQPIELARHIRDAMREGRINRGLQKGKEYTIFGTGRLTREGDQIQLRQLKDNERLTIVREHEGKTHTFHTAYGKPIKLEPGDLVYRGKVPGGKLEGKPFEYRGVPVKAERVPLIERLGTAAEAVKGLHLRDAVVGHIKSFGALFKRTPKAPVEGAMTRAEKIKALFDPLRTAQAKMASIDSSISRAPMTEIEKATAELRAAIRAEGLGEPVQAFRLKTSDAKVKPVALDKDGTAISFAAKTDDAASDLVPTFKPLKDAGADEAQVVIKNDNGRRLISVSEKSDAEVFIKRQGQDPIRVVANKPETGHWQEGDTLLVTLDGKTTSLEFERASTYRSVVEKMGELRSNLGHSGLLQKVWASDTNWWSAFSKFTSRFRRGAAAEADSVTSKVKVFTPNRKGEIQVDSSTNVKIIKSDDGSRVRGAIETSGDLFVKRGTSAWQFEKSGKANLLPGYKFRIGMGGDEHLFTGTAIERTSIIKPKVGVVSSDTPHVKVKERILRYGVLSDIWNGLRRRPERMQRNILRRASETAGDSAEVAAPFYRVKFTSDSKPVLFTSDARLGGIYLPSLKFSGEPLAAAHPKFDGARVTALQLEMKTDQVKMFVTDAKGSVMTRITTPTDLPEGSFLRAGDELFEVKRVGNDLVLDHVQSTKLTQGMMRQQPGTSVELVEKSYVQSNKIQSTARADNWEVKGAGNTTYAFRNGSVTLGADEVAVINKADKVNFAPKQAKVSFEPDGVFVEALTDKPVFLLHTNEAGEEVANLVKQGERVKFDLETQSVRLGNDSDHGRTVFSFKQKEEVKASPVATRTAPEDEIAPAPAAARTERPVGEPEVYRAPRVVHEATDAIPAPAAVAREVAPDIKPNVIKENLRKDIGAIFKSQGLDSALSDVDAALRNALAKVNFEKLTPAQISRELNSIFRELSLELRFEAFVHDKTNIIIKTLKQGTMKEYPLDVVVSKVEPDTATLNTLVKEFVSGLRRSQFKGAAYDPRTVFSMAINNISAHGEPEQIVNALNREFKQYGYNNRFAIKFEDGQFKVSVLDKGKIDPDTPFFTFDSSLKARVADVDTILPSASKFEQTTAEHLDRFSSELNRIAKADFAGDPASDAFRLVDDMINDFKANPSPERAFELERLANQVFESNGLSARFNIEFDSVSGRLALFDKEKPPLVKFVDQIFDPPPASLPRSLEAIQQDATIAARQAMVEKERDLQAKLIAFANSHDLSDLDAAMTQMRALAPDYDGGVLDMVERANSALSENGAGHKARFQINGENELSVFVSDSKIPIAEVNLLRAAAKVDVVPDLRPRVFDVESSVEQLNRLRLELDRVAKADYAHHTTKDAIASVTKLIDEFNVSPSSDGASALASRANQLFESNGVGRRFKLNYDVNTGKLALFDNQMSPLGHVGDVRISTKPVDVFEQERALMQAQGRGDLLAIHVVDVQTNLLTYASSGLAADFDSLINSVRTFAASGNTNAREIVQHVNDVLERNNAAHRLRFIIKGDNELSVFLMDSSRPVIEIDLLNPVMRSSATGDVVPNSIPAGALSVSPNSQGFALLDFPEIRVRQFDSDASVFRVENKLFRLDSTKNFLLEVPGGAEIIRETLTRKATERIASISAIKDNESIRRELKAFLREAEAAAIGPDQIHLIKSLADRSGFPLSDLQYFYIQLVKENTLNPGTRRAVNEGLNGFIEVIASREKELAGLLSKESVSPSELVRVAKTNSESNFISEEIANNFLKLANQNIDNISSADAQIFFKTLEQIKDRHSSLANNIFFRRLSEALRQKEELLTKLKGLSKRSPIDLGSTHLTDAIKGKTQLLDDASLIALAAAVKKGHMTPENSKEILGAIAARKAIRPFGTEAENAFASAHLEFVAKNLGITTQGSALYADLARLLQTKDVVNSEMVDSLISVIRTGKFSPDDVSEISKLVGAMQNTPNYVGLGNEIKGALLTATRQLEARFMIRPIESVTFNGSVVIGDVFAPANATEALIIPGGGIVNFKAFGRSSNLRSEFENLAGNIDTRDIRPGQTFLLRNTDKELPYNTVMMIGDKVDSQVKLSDTLTDALLKLEADKKNSVSMPVLRLNLLRKAEAAIAQGDTIPDAFKFTEDDLIAEYVKALRNFRANSNGNLKQFTVIVTQEEAAFGARLNRAIEDVMREPIMGSPGVPDDAAAALPDHIRVAPPLRDGR